MSIRDACGDNRSRQIPGGTDRESRRIYDRILFNIWIHPKRENVKRAESFPVKRKYRPRGGLPYGSPPSAFPAAHYMGKREAYQVVFVKSDIDGMVLNFTGFVL